MAITAQMQSTVSAMYAALFNRAPEKAGFDFWCAQLESGVSAAAMAQTMFNTAPARATYPDGMSNAAIVAAFYQNVLGRAGDTEGLAFWTAKLNNGATKGQLIAEMVAAVQSYSGTDPAGLTSKALFDNKVAVGVTYAVTLGKQDIELAKTVLSLVTATDKTAAEAAANVGQTFTLTTGTDSLIGTSGNDTFNGAATAYANTDRVIDTSTTDNDTYNVSIAANATIDATNVENVNVTTAATSALTVTASSLSGVKVLTVTPGDVSVGGSTIVGSKTVTVDKLSSAKVAKLVVGAGVTGDVVVDMTQTAAAESKAGVEVLAMTASGNVTVTGATTLNAAAAADTVGEKIIVKSIVGAAAAENAKAVTINADKALDIEVQDNGASKFTGTVTVNAALATEVAVANAVGGVTINAAKAADSTGNGIVVANIDDSGATITTGSYGAVVAGNIVRQGKIDLGGTAATNDVATVAAAGYVGLTTNTGAQIETLNLSGNAAAVQYAITGAASTYNLTGDKDVTLTGAASSFDGKTVADATTAGVTSVKLTTLATADLSKVAADKIVVASNVASQTLTVATGANLELASDIGTAFTVAGKTTGSTVNISTGDDTNASGATISIDTGAFTAATNIAAVNLSAAVGKFSATSTVLDGNATTGATLTITGSKDVALGTVTAKAVSAADFTGKLSLTANGADTARSITSGKGDDTIVLNQAVKFTVDAGAGDNTITVTDVAEASSIATGAGADTINLNSAAAIAVVTGAGDDTVNVGAGVATDAIIVMGDGTGDKLIFAAGALDLSTKANYTVTGVETVDISAVNGTVKVKASSFANDNTFKLIGAGTGVNADSFHVVNTGTAGAVIDASGVTFNSTQDATLILEGKAKLADTITGSAKNDTIIATTGADIVNGGEGTDTFNAANLHGADIEGTNTGSAAGVVINLGSTAVTNTAILAGTGGFTANSVTSVDGGKTAYLFSAAAGTNSAVQQTLSSIENVVGTTGRDYIVGSANDNVITGGAGADYINVGVGTDTVAITATGQTGAGVLADGTLTSVDVVVGMSAGDKIDLSGLGVATLASIATTNEGAAYFANATTGGAVLTQGTYTSSTGAFAASAGGADLLFVFDTNGATAGGLEAIVLIGSNAGIASFSSDANGVFTFA